MGPDLKVIGEQKNFGQPRPKTGINPVVKVPQGRSSTLHRVDHAAKASLELIARQEVNVILQGVRNEAVTHPYPGLPLMFQPRIAEQLVHQVIKVAIVRKLNVSTNVPGEAMA